MEDDIDKLMEEDLDEKCHELWKEGVKEGLKEQLDQRLISQKKYLDLLKFNEID